MYTGVWARLGTFVSLRPVAVAAIGLAVLGGLSLGVTQLSTGLAQTERFTSTPEAVRGQKGIADSFAAGRGSPTIIISDAQYAEEVEAAVAGMEGVDSVTMGQSDGTITQLDVVLSAAAETSGHHERWSPSRRRVRSARVLPLITLAQIGTTVCIGVLLDKLLVRTVIVPALAFIAGDAFWWPRRPARLSLKA